MKSPKIQSILALVMIAAILALPACVGTDPAEIARRQKAAAIGEKLLKIGVRYKVITPEEASDIKDIGVIVLNPEPEDPALPKIETTSGK